MPSNETSPTQTPTATVVVISEATLALEVVLSGTVADFAPATFKERLAGSLEGVTPADIVLNVTSASVRVAASITLTNATAANHSMTALAAHTPATLSVALGGMQVERIAPPTLTWSVVSSNTQAGGASAVPATPTMTETGGSSITGVEATEDVLVMVLTVITAVLCGGILIAGVVCCCPCRRGGSSAVKRHGRARIEYGQNVFDAMDLGPTSPNSRQDSAPDVVSSTFGVATRTSDVGAEAAQDGTPGRVASQSALGRARAAKSSPSKNDDNPFFSNAFAMEEVKADHPFDEDADMRL